ncbi:MAG: phosphoribosylanthranilate isomerase [Alphaproteobacteria bacterium]
MKICGLRTLGALEAALDAGADYIGLVFYEASPRNVSLADASALAAMARGKTKSVALLVDPDDETVKRIADEVNPDLIQLHGSESPERVAQIKQLAQRPVMKVIKVGSADDVAQARAYSAADIILFDAKTPEEARDALPGGNGIPFDWVAFAGVEKNANFMLSGGLNPDNVRLAIATTGAPMVDVSSGVESAPGEKDPGLIRSFIAAAKAAP